MSDDEHDDEHGDSHDDPSDGHDPEPDLDPDSDRALLDRWRTGDNAAGKRLFERHGPRVTQYFQRLLYDMSEVRALVNDTFMTCRLNKTPFKGPSRAFRAYLLGVAHNKFREYLRRKRTGERLIDAAVDADEVAEVSVADLGIGDPSEFVERHEERKLMLKGLRRIPVDYQLLFMLSFWEELSNVDIARALDLPVGTVASRLRLAKPRLEKELTLLKADPTLLKTTTTTLSQWLKRMQALAAKKKKPKKDDGSDEPGGDRH